jgi:MFS family permease
LAPGFYFLLAAQFVSALADNALLLVAMSLLIEQQQQAFWVPLLKLMFTLSYVVLGPWVGAWADTWPKHQVMMGANGIKCLACLAMLLGLNPIVAFGFAGLGAAIYAPAKYGLITEMEPAHRLVRANGWIEVSTVCAALFGMVLGGFLVGPTWLNSALCVWLGAGLQSFGALAVSLAALLAFYALAAALNRLIPDSGVRYAPSPWLVSAVCARFLADQRALWRDPLGSISLAVTTLFWGVGATLQLLVLAWAQQALHLSLEHAAYLQAATAIGVIAGAALAARLVALEHTPKVLGVGILLGLLLPLMSLVHAWQVAAVLTFVLGLVGGFFVVPMNALLQHRGATLLSAGRSISVQNTNENASVLAMMGLYSALLYAQVDVDQLVWMLGALVALGMGLVQWRYWALKSSQRAVAGQGLGQL